MHYFGEDMLFVPRLGWYRWQEKRWLADEDELTVRRDAQHVAAQILNEVAHMAFEPFERDALELARTTAEALKVLETKMADERSEEEAARLLELREFAVKASRINAAFGKRKTEHRGHAKNSGNTSKISNMLQEARTEKACSINDLNADPLMVNVGNGTLHFKFDIDEHDADWGDRVAKWKVVLLPHNREHMISKLMPVEYVPGAPCPEWLGFLNVVQPDAGMQDFLQRWCGYCLTGKTTEQKLVFNFGHGRNGKSTFVDLLARIFADYGTTVPIETLTGSEQRKGSDATPDLVKLPGARFVRASEPEQGTRMKEALIKALTGGEAIMIRRMMQEFVEVQPEFKLMISGNHKPEIRGSDDGIWRRVLLVPWAVQIDKEAADKDLPDKLWDEAEGILAWLVDGCLKYLQTGLEIPEVVSAATDDYRQESDKMRLFLQTECNITGAPEAFEKARDLADAFNGWLISRGDAVWGRRQLSIALKDRAAVVQGPNGQHFSWKKRSDSGYGGISLTKEARDRISEHSEEIRAGAARKG
ncbi:phage/plasmid primase, P4 family [Falsihalocynthiibacter arcticus]|uniref:phage/plasmid primase, P4 family n=1 Tax=Falsihalocynthiibacter arcticus TaxID=1579316 RepID=UPI003002A288